jgi:hypothetical protein
MTGRASAAATWTVAAAVVAGVALGRSTVDPAWAALSVLVALLAVLPAAVHRSWRTTAPATLGAVAVLAPLVRAFGTDRALDGITGAAAGLGVPLGPAGLDALRTGLEAVAGLAGWIALATAALLVVAQVQRFSSLHLTVRFAALTVGVATVGLTTAWTLVRYGAHLELGTAFPGSNAALAREFGAAVVAGAVAGGAFAPVFCRGGGESPSAPGAPRPGGVGRGIGRALVVVVQLLLLGAAAVGVRAGDVGVATNAAGGLLVTLAVPALRRDAGVTIHPALGLWIGAAVLLHTAGTFGPYATYPWYDTVTHTFSASVVAAVGYALARALDTRQECLRLPAPFLFAYVLLFVLAAGAVWEVFEYLLGVGSAAVGIPAPLTQPSVADTVTDLAFDAVGGAVVAALATLYLGDGLVEFVGPSAAADA